MNQVEIIQVWMFVCRIRPKPSARLRAIFDRHSLFTKYINRNSTQFDVLTSSKYTKTMKILTEYRWLTRWSVRDLFYVGNRGETRPWFPWSIDDVTRQKKIMQSIIMLTAVVISLTHTFMRQITASESHCYFECVAKNTGNGFSAHAVCDVTHRVTSFSPQLIGRRWRFWRFYSKS